MSAPTYRSPDVRSTGAAQSATSVRPPFDRMRVAFCSPEKPTNWPTPSGDRTLARAFVSALRHLNFVVTEPARFRTFDREGNVERQEKVRRVGLSWADRLIRRYQMGVEPAPDVWLTYHLYHKAPDWVGPRVARALGIPYLVIEASLSPKAAAGPWALGHSAVETALSEARGVFS